MQQYKRDTLYNIIRGIHYTIIYLFDGISGVH